MTFDSASMLIEMLPPSGERVGWREKWKIITLARPCFQERLVMLNEAPVYQIKILTLWLARPS